MSDTSVGSGTSMGHERFLDPEQVTLYHSSRGKLVLRLDGQEHEDLSVRRAFPLEMPTRYIGFSLPGGEEMGMLEDTEALDEASREVLDSELAKVYFLPVITDIPHIGEDHGVVYVDVETSSGSRQLEIRGIRNNIRLLSKNRALIQDVEGTRYELRDWGHLPKITREILGL